MPLFVTGGGLRIDYVITHDGRVLLNMPGGNSLYSAIGARIWGNDVAPWARMGENYPRTWLDELSDHGIKPDLLIPIDGKHDHRTFYSYTPDGLRVDTDPASHFARIDQPFPEELKGYVHSTPKQDNPEVYDSLALRPEDWPIQLHDVAAVHLAPLPIRSHLSIPGVLRRFGVSLITLDPGERYMVPTLANHIRRLIPLIDVFMPSRQELLTLFGQETSLERCLHELNDWGAGLVVVKLGAAGSVIADYRTGQRYVIPAYHSSGSKEVIDVTGAGDAYCGGFLSGFARTGDPLKAGLMGAISASIVIEGYGVQYALSVSTTETEKRLDKLTESVRQ